MCSGDLSWNEWICHHSLEPAFKLLYSKELPKVQELVRARLSGQLPMFHLWYFIKCRHVTPKASIS